MIFKMILKILKPLSVALAVMMGLSMYRCARVSSPTGGKKDTIPPLIITANPLIGTTNFSKRKITFKFDEYVKLNRVYSQLVVSPPLKHRPEIIPLGTPSKKITIKIKDTLLPNTTYVMNFGNSLEDNNEGNVLEAFSYIFSTGAIIDSLEVKGTVAFAKSRKEAKNITVALYPADTAYNDSLPYKEKPTYIANTLDTITFNLTHLREGTYHVVALKDLNNDYKFQPQKEMIGFLDKPIAIPRDTVCHLRIFREVPAFKVVRPIEQGMGRVFIGYKGKWGNTTIAFAEPKPEDFKYFITPMKDKDTLVLWHNAKAKDSLFVHIQDGKKVDSVYRVKLRVKKIDTVQITTGIFGTLHPRDTFSLKSTHPIVKIDTAQIHFFDKDTTLVKYDYIISKAKDRVLFDFKRTPKNKYYLQALPKGVIDFFGQTNDTIMGEFKTEEKDYYAILELKFKNMPTEVVPWVYLLDESSKVILRKKADKNQSFRFENLEPGTYYVQLLLDANDNGVWDTGNFLKKRQPERVINFGKPLKLRSNWELVEQMDVNNPIFVPKKGEDAQLENEFNF